MSTTTQDPRERDDVHGGELEFYAGKGNLLIGSVIEAWRRTRGFPASGKDTSADRFMRQMIQAKQRFGRVHRETGDTVREDAIRAGLECLEEAVEIREYPERIDELIRESGIDVGSTLADHIYAASTLLDWAVIGGYERLAELEEERAA